MSVSAGPDTQTQADVDSERVVPADQPLPWYILLLKRLERFLVRPWDRLTVDHRGC